jgi:hypothetical protein
MLLILVAAAVIGAILGLKNQGLSLSSPRVISYGIDAGSEPAQYETGFFQNALPVRNGVATLSSDASYSISAKVESIRAYDDSISAAVPFDVLLAWGEMADSSVDSRLEWEQGDRQGSVSGTLKGSGPNVSSSYVAGHVSNNHLVPANDRIRSALATIEPGDMVKIDGHLVDLRLQTSGNRVISAKTSKSRFDQGDGACEIILVDQIQINDRHYQ